MKKLLPLLTAICLLVSPMGALADGEAENPPADPPAATEEAQPQSGSVPEVPEQGGSSNDGQPDANGQDDPDAPDGPANGGNEGLDPENGAPENGTPENGAPENGTPENGAPENGTPENNAPDNNIPENNVPENGGGSEGEGASGNEDPAPQSGESTGGNENPDIQGGENPGEGGNPEAQGGDNQPQQPNEDPQSDSPELSDEIPEDAEAWIRLEQGRFGGNLADVLERLEGNETVFLRADKVLFAEKANIRLLSTLTFEPDAEVFRDGKYEARVSEDDPAEAEEYVPVDWTLYEEAGEEDTIDLYIWVEKLEDEPEEPGDEPADQPDDPGEPVLSVDAQDYAGAVWSSEIPTFTLSGIPEDAENWSYAAIIYDERIVILSGDTYVPSAEGVYTVRFAMLDAIGDIVDASERYTLQLDHTMPEEVFCAPDESADYTLNLTASDSMSGVTGYSIDGGGNWTDMTDGEAVVIASNGPTTLEAGMVQVRDAAGNIWQSTEPYMLEKRQSFDPGYYGGGGGGGGGGGSGKPSKQHAKGDGEKTPEYDAVALELPEEPMEKLIVGEEELELTLTLEAAQQEEAPLGAALFTAALGSWTKAPELDDEGNPIEPDPDAAPELDTLILTAEPEINLGDRFTYRWDFNGEVARLLAHSGIRYLALKVGEDMAVFPTEGFTGGAKYTELKMQGVSTRKFDYAVEMRVNLDPAYVSALTENDFSRECDMSLRVKVEEISYELTASPQSVMYFYDVFLGHEDMMEAPYGQYAPQAEATTDDAEEE